MESKEIAWTVITGSTGGIGRELAACLATRGRALALVNRSREKAEAQRDELRAEHPGLAVESVLANFMDMDQVARAGQAVEDLPGRVDALYNNAGILTTKKALSAQKVESHFAVNAVTPYQLIRSLRAKMARPLSEPPAMVINFASSAVNGLKKLETDSLVNPDKVGGLMSTYAQSKLAVSTLAPMLAPELKRENILIRSVDPGATRTPMTSSSNPGMPKFLALLARFLFKPADKQALKIVESADPSAFDGATGIYVANQKQKRTPAPAADAGTQEKLRVLLDGLLADHAG